MYFRFNNRKIIDEFSDGILMMGTKATGQKFWKSDKPGMRELFVQTLVVWVSLMLWDTEYISGW